MRLPATLVTSGMPLPLTFSNTTTGLFPAWSSSNTSAVEFEAQIDRLADPQQFVRIFGFDQPQEAAQALAVEIDISSHGCPLGVGLWSR